MPFPRRRRCADERIPACEHSFHAVRLLIRHPARRDEFLGIRAHGRAGPAQEPDDLVLDERRVVLLGERLLPEEVLDDQLHVAEFDRGPCVDGEGVRGDALQQLLRLRANLRLDERERGEEQWMRYFCLPCEVHELGVMDLVPFERVVVRRTAVHYGVLEKFLEDGSIDQHTFSVDQHVHQHALLSSARPSGDPDPGCVVTACGSDRTGSTATPKESTPNFLSFSTKGAPGITIQGRIDSSLNSSVSFTE